MELLKTIKNIFKSKPKMDKKQIKAFKVKLANFKKVSVDDFKAGRIIASELLADIEIFLKDDAIKSHPKTLNEFLKVKDGLNLYITNSLSLQGFNEKWKK